MRIFLTTYFEIWLNIYRRKKSKSTFNWGLAWTSLFSKMAAWPISWNCLSHLFTRQVIQTRMYLLVCWQTRIFWSEIWICICNLNLDLSQPRCMSHVDVWNQYLSSISFIIFQTNFSSSANTVPPPHTRSTPPEEPPQIAFDNVASLNEQQCREALVSWVGQNFFYGKECAEEMIIQKIHPSRDLHVSYQFFSAILHNVSN